MSTSANEEKRRIKNYLIFRRLVLCYHCLIRLSIQTFKHDMFVCMFELINSDFNKQFSGIEIWKLFENHLDWLSVNLFSFFFFFFFLFFLDFVIMIFKLSGSSSHYPFRMAWHQPFDINIILVSSIHSEQFEDDSAWIWLYRITVIIGWNHVNRLLHIGTWKNL